jgi:outer membrane receptor protein involved in Fe transport
VLTAQIARHEEDNKLLPSTAAGDTVQFRESALDNFQTGGFGQIIVKEFTRDAYAGALEKFAGHHDLKGGFEYEKEEAIVNKRMSGGQRVDILHGESGRPVYSHFYWTTPTALTEDAPTSALDVQPKHENTTFYLQDRWRLRPNFTLNVGLRWDRQEIFDRFGERVIDLNDDYAPRLGFIWDPRNDGRSKVFASVGRYYEQIPMDLVIRSFAQERQARIFNYSPTSTIPNAAAEADIGKESQILGGYFEPADPNIKNQYISEYLVGYEREVMPDVALGVKGIYREYGQVIEDFLCANPVTGELDFTYCIGNPGEGIMKRVYDYGSYGAGIGNTFPAPEAKREFKGLQVDVNKRFSNNWQGLVSYLYSKLDGNYDGGYSPFTNVGADPNISAMYDYYEFFTDGVHLDRITNTGPLSNDRRHQFKFSGVFMTPIRLSIGVSGYYRTGTPLTRYGFYDGYGRYELFLTKRGAEGRAPDIYEADVHFGYPLEAGPVTINFLADVFNVLNAQRPILVDQRWGFQESDNSSPTPVNAGYGQPLLRTQPTTFRLGVRVSM